MDAAGGDPCLLGAEEHSSLSIFTVRAGVKFQEPLSIRE
jgi:hypothetical protein